VICKDDLTIGILAGGKATRMGNNDKGLISAGGTPFVEILINKIIPHSKDIIINANRNISQYKKYNYPVVEDEIKGFKGPLSGIYSMLKATKKDYLFTLPCDCPNFSWEVIETFIENKKSNELCIAHNNLRSQPVFMLISKLKLKSLENYLKSGERKIDLWYKKNNYEYIYFDKNTKFFENINTMEQLKKYNEK